MIKIPRAKDTGDDAILPACRALVHIVSATHDEGDEKLLVRYRVLAAAVSDDGGKTFRPMPEVAGSYATEKFPTTPGAIPRLSTLFKRLGIQDRGDPAEEAAEYDPRELIARQLVCDVQQSKSEKGNLYNQWPWSGVWSPDDRREGVPAFVAAVRPTLVGGVMPAPRTHAAAAGDGTPAAAIPDDV